MFVCFSYSTKRAIQALFHSFNKIMDVILFFSILVFLYAGIGYKIFDGDMTSFDENPYFDRNINDFSKFFVIVNSFYVLFSFDNYPLLMRPFTDESEFYMIYFLPYILVNILIFMPIPIAVVYDSFRVKRSELAMGDNLIEKEALFICFLTLTNGK